jgi:hypothetical protein
MMRLAIGSMLVATLLSPLAAAGRDVDVRLVIDVSGSMKTGDPEYLRQDVLNGLADLLPPGSRAGVWTFGGMTNMVVPHGAIDAGWLRTARAARSTIGSVALRTNLRDALAKAAWDVSTASPDRDRHILLVTDGRVDLADDASANTAERRAIAQDLLPQLRAAGIRLDTLALSQHADFEFLTQLSNATNGYAGRADSVAAVRAYLSRATGIAPSVAFGGVPEAEFEVPERADELTLFAENTGGAFVLTTASNQRIDPSTEGVRRLDGDGTTLLTIDSPAAGTWRYAPASARVHVWPQLGIDIRPNDAAQAPELLATLTDGDVALDAPELRASLVVEAELKTLYGTEPLRVEAQPGEMLEYRVSLGAQPLTADDAVTVRFAGGTFLRTLGYSERPQHPIDAQVRALDGNAVARVQLNLPDMDAATLRVLGTTRAASGRVKLVVGEKQPDATWLVAVPRLDQKVDVKLKILFNSLNKKEMTVESDPIAVAFPLSGTMYVGLDADGHLMTDPVRPPPTLPESDAAKQADTESAAERAPDSEPVSTAPQALPLPGESTPTPRVVALWEWITMALAAVVSIALLVWVLLRSPTTATGLRLGDALAAYRAALAASSGAKPPAAATT